MHSRLPAAFVFLGISMLGGCAKGGDGMPRRDGGTIGDASALDASDRETGSGDSGRTDSGSVDSGSIDSGRTDSGSVDSGSIDAGRSDSGSIDSGSLDAGRFDAGVDARVDAGTCSGIRPESTTSWNPCSYNNVCSLSGSRTGVETSYSCVGGAWTPQQTNRNDTSGCARVRPAECAAGQLQLSAGYQHSCLRLGDGSVYCWGRGSSGRLGTGSINASNSAYPTEVAIDGAKSVAAGNAHSCALLNDGTVVCWGSNNQGQIGNGGGANVGSPTPVMNLVNATQIVAGGTHTCALVADGTVKCWGQNNRGQLGSAMNTSVPVTVPNLTGVVSIAAGFEHTCAVLDSGIAKCWGHNSSGQLGGGSSGTGGASLVPVINLTNVAQISAGSNHSCAVLENGNAYCWGNGSFGQLGRGSESSSATPVQVSPIAAVQQIACGYEHTCAVLRDGGVRCWGYNSYGQVGSGSASFVTSPVSVAVSEDAVSISTGYHSCAVLSDSTMECWGNGTQGQLGYGGVSDSFAPVAVVF